MPHEMDELQMKISIPRRDAGGKDLKLSVINAHQSHKENVEDSHGRNHTCQAK